MREYEQKFPETNPATGLTSAEAARRLVDFGQNKLLVEEQETRFLAILREEITEPMILLLLAVGVLYGVINQDIGDALTIVAIVTVLVLAEVYNEYKAKKSITALKKLAAPTTTVIRNGQPLEIPTKQVVLGDLLLLRQGERIPADAKLVLATGVETDESALTGESFPVQKEAAPSSGTAKGLSMVYAGTVIVKGRGRAVVTATGTTTELGKIAGITKALKEPKTPLQLSMKQLSKTLIWIALVFSILIPILSFLRGLAPTQAVLYGLSLSFATIPEEMPIIITMVLGVGAYTLSKKKAVVKRLRATETLGSTTVIATDKTGTITENKMQVDTLYFDGKVTSRADFGVNQKEALKTALLSSDAVDALSVNSLFSNPMSQAIVETLKAEGFDVGQLPTKWILTDQLDFDNKRKLASYIYRFGDGYVLLSSGAPESILANSVKVLLEGQEVALAEENRVQVASAVYELASKGQRLLGFGYRRLAPKQLEEKKALEQDFVFLGFLSFADPPRIEVREAILTCQEAGIRVFMVTGDHPETAKAIGGRVGIPSGNVLRGEEIAKMNDVDLRAAMERTFIFARTTPTDKLRLVRLLRENGEIVAVTGDGVNDAPALKEAHIGIAMGIRGTDVAKEAADMVLADDNFATLVTAVQEGRKIYANLRKGVRYYLACKIALVASFLLPIALGAPLPFAPIQIVVLELFMDLAASATFVAEPQERGVMKKPPTPPSEKFMNRTMLMTMTFGALSLFAAVSTCYLYAWYSTGDQTFAQTIAFATWMVGHIFLAFNLRSEKEPLLRLGLLTNKLMLLWSFLVAATLLVGTSLPYVHASLRITSLSLVDWMLVVAVSFAATFWMELKKLLRG